MAVLLLSLAFATSLLHVTAGSISSGYYRSGSPIILNGSYVNFTVVDYFKDTVFNPATYRDGGGGGMTGTGVMVLNFADSFTYTGPGGTAGTFVANDSNAGSGGQTQTSFVHNSFAIMKDLLTDFGSTSTTGQAAGNGNFSGMPLTGVSSDYGGNYGIYQGIYFAIWPQNNLLGSPDIPTLAQNQLIGVFPAINLSVPGGAVIYSTFATVNVNTTLTNGQVFVANRNVTKLFTNTETMYGTFCTMSNGTAGDGYMYLFGTARGGLALRMARVAWANVSAIADRSKYTYWTGSTWAATPPADSASAANILTIPSEAAGNATLTHGTVFWSNYFKSYMLISNYGGYFNIALTKVPRDLTSGFVSISNFWIEFEYVTTPPSKSLGGDIIYMLNVYPQLDKTGHTLIVSWSSTPAHVVMGKITFTKT